MRVRWSAQANRDINAVYDYLSARTKRGTRTVMTRIRDRVAALADRPLLAPAFLGTGARRLVITRTDYIVFYSAEPGEVVILRVMHGAQETPEEFAG